MSHCRVTCRDNGSHTACDLQVRACTPHRTCPNGFFRVGAGTATTDTDCRLVTVCGAAQYIAATAGTSTDTVCANLTVCVPEAQYESTPPSEFADRVCSDISECATTEYVV